MTAKRVLVVKMSSLGDVVHALPAVSDACAHPEVNLVVTKIRGEQAIDILNIDRCRMI